MVTACHTQVLLVGLFRAEPNQGFSWEVDPTKSAEQPLVPPADVDSSPGLTSSRLYTALLYKITIPQAIPSSTACRSMVFQDPSPHVDDH